MLIAFILLLIWIQLRKISFNILALYLEKSPSFKQREGLKYRIKSDGSVDCLSWLGLKTFKNVEHFEKYISDNK